MRKKEAESHSKKDVNKSIYIYTNMLTLFVIIFVPVLALFNVKTLKVEASTNSYDNSNGINQDAIPEIKIDRFLNIIEKIKQATNKDTNNDIDKDIKKFSEKYIDVPTIMQKPELPNGCEITSLTAVLNYYGYTVSKTEMADQYLPKKDFYVKQGVTYAPNPYEVYIGDPRELKKGWLCYTFPLEVAAKKYLDSYESVLTPIDMRGSTKEEIITQLDQGSPVIVWITLGLQKPNMASLSYINNKNEVVHLPRNLHCVVLNGYAGEKVHVMDPLRGQVTYDLDKFFQSYYDLGSHAMSFIKLK